MDRETLQFPLPILAYHSNVYNRLECSIAYATISTGMRRLNVLTSRQADEELANVTTPKAKDGLTEEQIKAVALGCTYCNVCPPENAAGVEVQLWRYNQVEKFLRAWTEAGMTTPWTRVPRNMVFEARDGNEKTYLRFAALCAVNSAIGSKPFAVVTRNRVRAGMLGYSSGKLLFNDETELTDEGRALLRKREDNRHPVTTNQVRTLLDNLVASGLLHRFTPYRGSITYYSKTLSAEMIGELVLSRAKRTASNPRLVQIGEQIRRAKNGGTLLCGDISSNSPLNTKSPHNRETTTQAPPHNHPVTTQAPHNATPNATPNASSKCETAVVDLKELLKEISRGTTKCSYPDGDEPSLEVVQRFLESLFRGAGQYAEAWLKRMNEQAWKDHKGRPVRDWKKLAASWASTSETRKRLQRA